MDVNGSTQYDIDEHREVKKHKEKKTSTSKGADIGMVECQAYGEVEVRYTAGGNIEDNVNVDSAVYEDI